MSMKVTRAEFIGTERMDEAELRDFAHDLLAENEKLREEVELVGTAGYLLAMKQLKDENKKLRELSEALADCRNTSCDDCVRWDYPQGGCTLDGVMRELGMEVPE